MNSWFSGELAAVVLKSYPSEEASGPEDLAMAAEMLGYICLCLHLNHIFLVLANHSQPSPGLDLFKPEGKLYLFLFKTAKTRADFKRLLLNSSSTP